MKRKSQVVHLTAISVVGLSGIIYTIASSPDDRYWLAFLFFSFIFSVPLTIIFREYNFFEDVKCKVIEKDGKSRYTYVYRNWNKTVYKIHGRNGEWVILDESQIKKVQQNHPKKVQHGARATVELSMT